MSDLCYNCGDCHLPRPCPLQLKQCEICGNWGHCYSFCPRSVRTRDPQYQFWALCHNCDAWHLPDPCKNEMRVCRQCGNYGHLEYFCPVHPISRQATHALNHPQDDTKTGVKRQRTSESDVSETTSVIAAGDPLRAEYIRLVKTETACSVIRMRNQGFGDSEILRQITRAPLETYFNNDSSIIPDSSIAKMADKAFTPPIANLQRPITPSTSVYASQHERFSSGELAQNANTYYSHSFAADSAPPGTKPASRKKSTRGVACAECKGSKKRCPHGDTAVYAAPPPGYVEATSLANGTPSSTESWGPALTNSAFEPTYTGTMPDSTMSTIVSPSGQAQNYEKASLSHLLNVMPADQQGPAKQFTHTPMPNTSATGSYNLPAMTAPSSHIGAVDTAVMSQSSAQSHPDPVSTAGQAFVMIPHVTESEQNHASEPIQSDEAMQMEGQMQADVQTQSNEPQAQVQPQPQSEANSETTQGDGKTKKTRGRPKRKN